MIEYKSGERLGFIKKAHTRKSVLVQYIHTHHKLQKGSSLRFHLLHLMLAYK